MRPKTREAMRMLYHAKWNVPQAAEHCGLSVQNTKIVFNEYCQFHKPLPLIEQLPLQI